MRVPEKSGLAGGTRSLAPHRLQARTRRAATRVLPRAAGEDDAALARWYLGARVALAIPSNPEGLVQATLAEAEPAAQRSLRGRRARVVLHVDDRAVAQLEQVAHSCRSPSASLQEKTIATRPRLSFRLSTWRPWSPWCRRHSSIDVRASRASWGPCHVGAGRQNRRLCRWPRHSISGCISRTSGSTSPWASVSYAERTVSTDRS